MALTKQLPAPFAAPLEQEDVHRAAMLDRLRPDLRLSFLWSFTGTSVYAACQWGMLVGLAKLGNVEMVGQFALALAITAPVFMFTNLHLRGMQATDARGMFRFRDYVRLRVLMTGFGLVVIAVLAAVAGDDATTMATIFGVGVAKAVETIGDIFHGLLQRHERMNRIAWSMILKGLLCLAALGVAVQFSQSMVWGTVALAGASLASLLGYDWWAVADLDGEKRTGDFRSHLSVAWNLARIACPLGMVMFIVSITSSIPRYYIENLEGLRELGIFAGISYLIIATGRVLSALGEATSPRLARFYATGDRSRFALLLLGLVGFAAVLGLSVLALAAIAGPELLAFLYSVEFAEHGSLFVWIAVGGVITNLAAALSYAMTAARFFFIQAPLFLAAAGITALACAWLVPSHGLVGAAWAVALGQAVLMLGSAAVVGVALRGCGREDTDQALVSLSAGGER
jgi:O-antigen/teichoic acid export membrane protein